jgi:hypothetical protein
MRIATRPIVLLTALILVAGIIGCLKVGLGDPEKSKLDDQLTGLWLANAADGDGESQLVSIIPYDARTSLVTYMNFTRDAQKQPVAGGQLSYKAWRTDVAGTPFLTLELKSPALLLSPTDEKFVVMKLTRTADSIQIHIVDDQLLDENKVTTPEALEKLIAANLNNPALFDANATFTRLGQNRAEEATSILSAFGHDKP